MPIKAIVFDFGNVVGYFDHLRTSRRLAEHSELPVDVIHAHLFGGQLGDDYESGRLATSDFIRRVREVCQLRCSDELVAAAWADIFWPNPEVCALLPQLKPSYRLLLGSNTNELHAQQFCRQFRDVFRHFDALVLSHEVGACKPNAAFFHHCQRRAGCPAGECLFIDDVSVNVAGALACGLHGIVYREMADLRKQLGTLGVLGSSDDKASRTLIHPQDQMPW
jgi:putative hydrolase of the HAD superfamily